MCENKKSFNPRYDSVPNIKFSLRLTGKLQDELGLYAQKCNISMNTLILKCIEYGLENKKRLLVFKSRFSQLHYSNPSNLFLISSGVGNKTISYLKNSYFSTIIALNV